MSRKANLIAELVAILAALAGPLAVFGQAGGGIVTTKHNLTGGGPGRIKVVGLNNVCTPCHTPHAAAPKAPLWNRRDGGAYYQVYASPTLKATVPQPNGSSRLCLSCHDGTIALSQVRNPRNQTGGSLALTAQSPSYLGTDLRDDHPISFVYDSALVLRNPDLNDPQSLPRQLRRDQDNRVQCTTCHDPHNDTRGYFLTMDNHRSAMCRSCHNLAGWGQSGHANSSASTGTGPNGWWTRLKASSVADLGCEACHRPHTAGGREWLLYAPAEQDNCYACHNGTVAKDVTRDFLKVNRHPVERTGTHSPNENPSTMLMHVKCGDCHNPHQAAKAPATYAPFVPPQMKGVTGCATDGTPVNPAAYEYQVCLKCHGARNPSLPVVNRVISDPNLGNRFSTSNLSYHPLAAVGKNMAAPSLLPPRKASDRIYCIDCHGSDTPGVRGPHGSTFPPLLIKNYTTGESSGEGPAAYALCYSCHDRSNILSNASFVKHRLHIVDQRAPCSICHDPHGVAKNAHLINFDRDHTQPVGSVGPLYKSTGLRKGTCTVKCHGEVHNARAYSP